MLTEKQFKIFEVFVKNPFKEFNRNSIKIESKCNSNNELALTINLLKKEEVIIEKKIGKSGILILNMDNNLTFHYIDICNYIRTNLIRLELDKLKREIMDYTPFFSMVIFGSYSIGEQKKDSDLDISIFIEDKNKVKYIQAIINNAKLKNIFELDVHIILKSEMIEMLTNKEENLGKQIARKHLTFYNNSIFYEIIKEGMNHGFRI